MSVVSYKQQRLSEENMLSVCGLDTVKVGEIRGFLLCDTKEQLIQGH